MAGQKQADFCEFEASLVPIVTVRAVERDLISKTNKQQTNADVTSVEKIKMQRIRSTHIVITQLGEGERCVHGRVCTLVSSVSVK